MKIKEPRVLQLIDSLAAGGAERVSVNLANALSEVGIKSFLCATRKSGPLEQFIDSNVKKLILHKTSAIDLEAIYALVKFIWKNHINIIHAHSSSFFMAVLCKPFVEVKIVWHDHNGIRYEADQKQNKTIKYFSYFFDAVISVNEKLAQWSKDNLHLSKDKINYIQNFAILSCQNSNLKLPGNKENRIVSLSNLRWQKDHMTLLKAFKEIVKKYPNFHLLLVGQDNEDEYSDMIKSYMQEEKLEKNVHILGSRSDTADILLNSTIGVLSSESEGLPVALLEYGLAKLPVVSTDVGQCGDVLGQGAYGEVVAVKNSDALAESLLKLIEDEELRNSLALKFYDHVQNNYSKDVVINELIDIYKRVLSD